MNYKTNTIKYTYTKNEIIHFLAKFKPYTNNIIKYVECSDRIDQRIKKIMQMQFLYEEKLSLTEQILNKDMHIDMMDLRIKKMLELLCNFAEENEEEFYKICMEFVQIASTATRNDTYLDAKIDLINKIPYDDFNSCGILFTLDIVKDNIEGILNRWLTIFIYILEYNEGINPDINKIDERYFYAKYFIDTERKRKDKYLTIEENFPILFEEFDNSLRNANAHFDYILNNQNNTLIYKSRISRKAKVQKEITRDELNVIRENIMNLTGQINLAYLLFIEQNYDKVEKILLSTDLKDIPMYDKTFDTILAHIDTDLRIHSMVIEYYKYENNALVLKIKSYYNKTKEQLFEETVLDIAYYYLKLINSCDVEVDRIILDIDIHKIIITKDILNSYINDLLSFTEYDNIQRSNSIVINYINRVANMNGLQVIL